MSEAPAPTGESDSSGPIEPEKFEIGSALPHPPEKQGKTDAKSGNQGEGGGQTETNNETDSGATQTSEQTNPDDRGISVPPEYEKYLENDEEPPVNSPSVEAEKRDFESAVKDQNQTSNNDPPRIETIPRYGQREEGSQNRDKGDVREGRVFGTEIEQSPIAPQAPPKQTEEQTAETPEQEATNLFLALRSGKKSFRNTPGGKGWKAEGKIVTKEEGKPFQVFKEVDGNDERRILISELRKIADARVGYQRPKPPTPPPSSTPINALSAPPPDMAARQQIIDQALGSGRDEATPTAAATVEKPTPLSDRARTLLERFQTGSSFSLEEGGTHYHVVGELTTAKGEARVWKFASITDPRSKETKHQEVTLNEEQLRDIAQRTAATEQAKATQTKEQTEVSTPPPPNEPPKTTRSASPGEIEPEGEKHKNAELTAAQIITIDKLLGAQTDRSRETRFDIRGTKAALKEVRKQLGIKTRIMNEEGKLKSKFLDELRKAREEGRITLKEPNTQKTEAPPPPRGKVSEGLSNVGNLASRLAEKAGKVATGASSLTLTRQAEEGLRGAAEKSENKYQKFLYNAAAGFLNRFRWADKEQGTYAIGVVFGGGASLALGPAGNLVKIPILIGLNGIAVPGINFVRVRFINNALKPHIEDGAKREELSRQFDNAYRLWRPDSKEAFDNEIKRLSTEVAQGHDVPVEAQMLAQEEIQRKMESLNKYTRAQSHIRSFAAGLSAGSITASAGEAIFHGISSLIGGGGGSTAEGGTTSGGEASTNTPTPSSGEQPTVTPTPVVENEITDVETTPATEIGPPPGGINQTTWENFNEEQRDAIQFIMDNPDRQDDFVKFIAATQESAASNEVLGQAQEIIQNPDFVHSVEIAQGSTVSEMLASNGYDITWTTNDADIFGGHVLANYEELQQMHEQVKEAGIPLEFQDYPTPQEVVSLIKAAEGGDAAAFQQLVAASHWIPEGGSYNILTESGFEALKQKYGLS